jgi:hypothetical protein
MRCLACNVELTDEEANRKFENHEEIKAPEDKYIGLCNHCMRLGSDSGDDLLVLSAYIPPEGNE